MRNLILLAALACPIPNGVWVVKNGNIYYCLKLQRSIVCERFPKERIAGQFPGPYGAKTERKK